ncbi:hypothetical protein VC1_08 [Vibrio phage Vc1]|uniref:Uncharacterized protein n=1 Tax=Vibrio phage Vc1 TaxID=1480731 RepID=A0A9X9SEW4_9CAUD|nr:hypothetical protein KMB90_gp08 [Vibrio virus 2019VC1]
MAAEKIIIINTGLCVMFFNGENVMPEHEMEVAEKDLKLPGIESSIVRGEFKVKDDSDLNEEVVERAAKRKKKDPDDGKTKDELEDGGVYE